MSEETGWFAAAGQIVGTAESWSMDYSRAPGLHRTRQRAIASGLRHFGHDDFNVGRLVDGQLAWWGWMDEEHPAEDRPGVAFDLGLAGSR